MLARLSFCFQCVAALSARDQALSSCRFVGLPFPGTLAVILHSGGDEAPAAVCVVEQVDVEPVTKNL